MTQPPLTMCLYGQSSHSRRDAGTRQQVKRAKLNIHKKKTQSSQSWPWVWRRGMPDTQLSRRIHTHRSLFYICVIHSQRLIKLSRLWLFSNVCVYANMLRPAGCWDELCMCVWRVAWLTFLSIRLKPIVRRLKKQKSKKHSQLLLYLGGWASRGQCAGEIQLSWLRNFALFLSFFVSRSFLFNFHLHPLALSPYKGAVCLISNHIWTSQTLSFYPTKPLNKQTIILPSLSREYGELMPPAVYHIMLNQCLWDCQTVIPYKN